MNHARCGLADARHLPADLIIVIIDQRPPLIINKIRVNCCQSLSSLLLLVVVLLAVRLGAVSYKEGA